jgi:hypothetical protein
MEEMVRGACPFDNKCADVLSMKPIDRATILGTLFLGVVIGCIVMILIEAARTSPQTVADPSPPAPAYYLIDVESGIKGGSLITSRLRIGGPYSDFNECFDARRQAEGNAVLLVVLIPNATDDFECKRMESTNALALPKGKFVQLQAKDIKTLP